MALRKKKSSTASMAIAAAKMPDGGAPTQPTGRARDGAAVRRGPRAEGPPADGIAKVSHTLHSVIAWRLREFAFYEGVSESAVIEFALHRFFGQGSEASLGTLLRKRGAARRRRQPQMFSNEPSGAKLSPTRR
ncbi:MAG: hypothetical protein M3T49_10795 [Candidatus Eremiobacteraeota bacterium]|nr:hypothetical protein [Candidatus Eremiobacteraeota bacterium]